MRRIEINNDGNPLGKFGDGDFNPKCYPDAVYMVNNLLEVIQVFVRELACSPGDGTITIDKIGNRMVLLAPDDPTAGFEIGEIGPRVHEADKAVRDAEREAALDASGRDLGGGAGDHAPTRLYDRMREMTAGSTHSVTISGPELSLMFDPPLPTGRPAAAKNELPIERPLDVERSDAGFTSGPVWIGGPGEFDGPHVYWSERDRGITHDMLMDACEGLSLEGRREAHIRAGAAGQTVTDLYNALLERKRIEMAAYASTFDPLDMGPIPHEDELVEQINARFGPALESAYDARPVADVVEALEGTQPTTGPSSCGRSWDDAGETQDGPNSAVLSPSVSVSETGSSASHAAQGGNPELAGDAHEWDALTKHLEEPRPSPAGPGQSNATFSGRFPAVDISKPIMD